ncbi:MAG: hypothetical protein A2Z45_06055 [Chloroflexi bacterium RBG_19FT_COMBO_55_16]|nr:MAG: hypothetical protein A2Z45_06055 [Chloroflexi bacterium RBG_19FT_COMBO_55_16]
MIFDQMAKYDFERARGKAFWRNVLSWLTGERNQLLPFDEVREHIPMIGQHYIGLQEVPIENIVGSLGRYRDFDRAFLPIQKRTKDRWVSIDRARYEEVDLPPVELYKMGEVYFVKDGNHRVSVARERGQLFVDAVVTEIQIAIPLTVETQVSDLDMKGEYATFIEKTRLTTIRPSAQVELTLPGEYDRLLDHINVHRWYLGEQRKAGISFEEAVASWYDNVYVPLSPVIAKHEILPHFPGRTVADLYLWIIEYLWYLREAYKEEFAIEEAAQLFTQNFDGWPESELVSLLKRASWVDYLILKHERASFLARTKLEDYRPQANIELTIPGLYEKLIEHINVHQWYLGEQRKTEVKYEEAVISWYDHVYMPLVNIIRKQKILDEFPGRTESDLYLWIIEHQGFLRETFGGDISLEAAAEHFTEDVSVESPKDENDDEGK